MRGNHNVRLTATQHYAVVPRAPAVLLVLSGWLPVGRAARGPEVRVRGGEMKEETIGTISVIALFVLGFLLGYGMWYTADYMSNNPLDKPTVNLSDINIHSSYMPHYVKFTYLPERPGATIIATPIKHYAIYTGANIAELNTITPLTSPHIKKLDNRSSVYFEMIQSSIYEIKVVEDDYSVKIMPSENEYVLWNVDCEAGK